MIKNITCTALFFITFSMLFAQNDLNEYKYIIVPTKFEFQNNDSQYNLNAQLKFLFEKNNFNTLMSSEALPEDLINNGCLSLKANLIDESNLFKTRIKIQLKNCRDEVVYTSNQGMSREKAYKKAYQEAIRSAFESIKTLNYKYVPITDTITSDMPDGNTKTEIEKLKEEIKDLKAEKKSEGRNAKLIVLTESEDEVKGLEKPRVTNKENKRLLAELIPGSVFNYELKNNEGETQYTLLFSGKEDVFIVKNENALIYKKNNAWIMAQFVENNLQTNAIDIQF